MSERSIRKGIRFLCVWFVFLCLGVGCQRPSLEEGVFIGLTSMTIIYGKDDRKDAWEHPDAKLRKLSSAEGALFSSSRFKVNATTGVVTIAVTTLNEKFKSNPSWAVVDTNFRLGWM